MSFIDLYVNVFIVIQVNHVNVFGRLFDIGVSYVLKSRVWKIRQGASIRYRAFIREMRLMQTLTLQEGEFIRYEAFIG